MRSLSRGRQAAEVLLLAALSRKLRGCVLDTGCNLHRLHGRQRNAPQAGYEHVWAALVVLWVNWVHARRQRLAGPWWVGKGAGGGGGKLVWLVTGRCVSLSPCVNNKQRLTHKSNRPCLRGHRYGSSAEGATGGSGGGEGPSPEDGFKCHPTCGLQPGRAQVGPRCWVCRAACVCSRFHRQGKPRHQLPSIRGRHAHFRRYMHPHLRLLSRSWGGRLLACLFATLTFSLTGSVDAVLTSTTKPHATRALERAPQAQERRGAG